MYKRFYRFRNADIYKLMMVILSSQAYIQVAQLAMKNIYHYARVQLVGWGRINKHNPDPSAVLKYVNITQVSRSGVKHSPLNFPPSE